MEFKQEWPDALSKLLGCWKWKTWVAEAGITVKKKPALAKKEPEPSKAIVTREFKVLKKTLVARNVPSTKKKSVKPKAPAALAPKPRISKARIHRRVTGVEVRGEKFIARNTDGGVKKYLGIFLTRELAEDAIIKYRKDGILPTAHRGKTGVKHVYVNKSGNYTVQAKKGKLRINKGTYKTLAEAKKVAKTIKKGVK